MSSSSSPYRSQGGVGPEEEGGGGGGDEGIGPSDPALLRSADPSPSRRRSADAVWPEHFVESVAIRVALDASHSGGRLAAAPAVVSFFQVCSAWRAASRSELLWRELVRLVFSRDRALLPSWQDEFVRLHRTARNFRSRHYSHVRVLPPSPAVCRRLAVSDSRLAAGFLDGSVALFDLPSCSHLTTYIPHATRERLGRYSLAISGLILLFDRLVFASQDGDIHVADLEEPASWPVRRAHVGNLVEDGTLVDFSGNNKSWVGLYAGVPGRSFRVWNGDTEQLLYVGGSLTDPDSVAGWHLLTDMADPSLCRVRVAEPGAMVGCSGSRLQSIDLEDVGRVLDEVEFRRAAIVDTMDACDGKVIVVDARGVAKVRLARTLEEMCRFSTVRRVGGRGAQQQQEPSSVAAGCMNWGYVVVCTRSGVIRVWDAATGEFLYRFRERIGVSGVMTASYRHVVAWSSDTGLHLWDFGAFVDG